MMDKGSLFDAASFLATLTHKPGIYRMLDVDDALLYVGKANNLKKRVSSYFTGANNGRTQLMVSKIQHIQTTVVNTEVEALILEAELIKSLKPKFNVLLRDDKSYPYIFLSNDDFPRLTSHRGAKKSQGQYFGPYPNAGSMRDTLQLLQKLFPVRQCDETFYRNRSRPCLQYQIKRCTAPCVDFITPQDYAVDVKDAVLFLQGKTHQVIDDLVQRMEMASEALAFERAAIYRDQIAQLGKIQARQYVSGEKGDIDIIACDTQANLACIQLFFIRGGRNLGNKVFYPKIPTEETANDIIQAFITQYYLDKSIPKEVILSHDPLEKKLLEEALSLQAKHKVILTLNVRGERLRWLQMAQDNAQISLASRLASKAGMQARMVSLQQALQLAEIPTRMECFDISHTGGELTVASCVVFDQNGPLKSDYRRFNIAGITGGDDYAAMEQALTRRYKRIQSGEGRLPDILFIDGGKGQISSALKVLNELAVSDIMLIGIAKGPTRKAGMETLILQGEKFPIQLPDNSPALHLIQNIRDESHRFAITGHRRRRDKKRRTSTLESIAGVGPKRRQRLLKQLGGLQGVARAGIDDLIRIEGINQQLAEKIHATFHGNE